MLERRQREDRGLCRGRATPAPLCPGKGRAGSKIVGFRTGFTLSSMPVREGVVAGFTLIELLVATAIMAVAVGVIGACIGAGLKVWDRARETVWLASSALPGVELLERDLRNATGFSGTPFEGKPDGLVLGVLMRPPDGSVDGPRIGKVKYGYDARKTRMLRKAWLFPDPEPPDQKAESVLEDVQSSAFSYRACAAGNAEEYCGTATNLPSAVRFELVLGKPPLTLKREVLIPAGMK